MNLIARTLHFLRVEKEELSFSQMVGPLFMISALSLASPRVSLFLMAIAWIGLYFSARWQIKGCTYALILLVLGGLLHHLFLDKGHFSQICLEASLALSFLITALSFEESKSAFATLSSQLQAKEAAIQNLEEEFASMRGEKEEALIASQQKRDALEKELEEIRSEQSSLLVLNEVLRAQSAATALEKKELQERKAQALCRSGTLEQELYLLRTELSRLKSADPLAQQNQELFQELNKERAEKQQTRLINETLVRLHAKEAVHAKELEGEKDKLQTEGKELRAALSHAQTELETLSQKWGQLSLEREAHQTALQQKEEQRLELNFLKERLAAAEMQIQTHRDLQAHQENLEAQKNADRAQIEALLRTEQLYQQLRKQFDEKSQVLQETRAQLFHTDTEVQTLRRSEAERELLPPPPEIVEELEGLEEKIEELQRENQELLELVSILSPKEAGSKKKRRKTPEQEPLFE